jgi:hypothetical protein
MKKYLLTVKKIPREIWKKPEDKISCYCGTKMESLNKYVTGETITEMLQCKNCGITATLKKI